MSSGNTKPQCSPSSMNQTRRQAVASTQPSTPYLNQEDMYLWESAARPPPPPPAPPSTPVVKQHAATQKHHHQLLQQLPKMLANGISLARLEDYMWLDPSGRPTTPPRTMSPQDKAQSARKVAFELVVNDNLGLMIRGGIEYGLGIYVTGVDEESAAFRNGLRVGDEIISVNGNPFERLTHDEAVSVLKSSPRLSFLVRYIGKVPHSSLLPKNHRASGNNGSSASQNGFSDKAYNSAFSSSSMNIDGYSSLSRVAAELNNSQSQNSSKSLCFSPPSSVSASRRFSCGDGAESVHDMNDDFHHHQARHLFANTTGGASMNQRLQNAASSLAGGNGFARHHHPALPNVSPAICVSAYDDHDEAVVANNGCGGEMTSPEMSMVLEKAMVLLNSKEFSILRRLLAEYEASEISVDTFAESLLQLIRDQEKASFFTEIREVVRQEDLIRFDRLIFGRKGNLFDLLLADATNSAPTSRRSMAGKPLQQTAQEKMQRQPINAVHFAPAMDMNRFHFQGETEFVDEDDQFEGHQHFLQRPPLYDESQSLMDVHPSIAGFPRKANRSVTFKGLLTVEIPKCCSSLGIAIEGGTNTLQPLPRIISIQPNGAAYQNQELRVGQLISEVDGYKLTGLPHESVAKLIAECFAKRDRNMLTLVVMDQKLTPAEMRRSFMQPQS